MNGPDPAVLVTGGTGCIGAVTVRELLAGGVRRVVVASRSRAPGKLALWLDDPADPRVERAPLDLGDPAAIRALVSDLRPTRVVHLGALQSPDCDADPELGLRVNVGGTLGLFEALRTAGGVERLVFASSAAVYGTRDRYPTPTVREDAPLLPPNKYGAWKLAGEALARQWHEATGAPTVCLRLNTTYGPGRDRGKTSAPTRAIEAVARGIARGEPVPFRMPYRGRENYHWVEDVGASFAEAALAPFAGFGAFNLRGDTVPVGEFLRLCAAAAAGRGHPDAADLGFAPDATDNPFVCDLDESAIRAGFPTLAKTPLADGIGRALDRFVAAARSGVPS
jgi:nucleoside-diphosphate-sugar epimerase